MGQGKKKGKKKAVKAILALKEEAARELGLKDDIAARGWGGLTSREAGKIGGYIARKLRDKQKGSPQSE